jgi:hypothetical protein
VTWKTIDSAPRDGTRVLVWLPALRLVSACEFQHGLWQHGIWTNPPLAVTHWQPLPPPPESEG